MKLVPVSGSAVVAGYGWVDGGDGTGLLAIGFHDGAEWWYRGVPERTFADFLMSESKGAFFRRVIEPGYAGVPKPPNE